MSGFRVHFGSQRGVQTSGFGRRLFAVQFRSHNVGLNSEDEDRQLSFGVIGPHFCQRTTRYDFGLLLHRLTVGQDSFILRWHRLVNGVQQGGVTTN